MKLPVIAIALSLSLASCEQEKEISPSVSANGSTDSLGRTLIETLPLAKEHEFPSADAAAEAFAQGLIDDNWDQILRATPLRLQCERITFEALVKDTRTWNAGHVTGDPSSPMAAFAQYSGTIGRCLILQQALLGEENPGALQQIEDPDDLNAIAAAKKRAIYSRPPDLRIAKVEVDVEMTERMSSNINFESPMRKALGVVDAAHITVEFEGVPGAQKIRIGCIMEKIDTNWLVSQADVL